MTSRSVQKCLGSFFFCLVSLLKSESRCDQNISATLQWGGVSGKVLTGGVFFCSFVFFFL
uniref:Uncharacterized protein n=1 Tax=Anguilla anguilla TaxID=7936 RepID=A0A0E9UK10_ANGAN